LPACAALSRAISASLFPAWSVVPPSAITPCSSALESVSRSVYEARIDYSGGYRLYYAKEGNLIVVMLCGGDKSSQKKDISKAIELAEGI